MQRKGKAQDYEPSVQTWQKEPWPRELSYWGRSQILKQPIEGLLCFPASIVAPHVLSDHCFTP